MRDEVVFVAVGASLWEHPFVAGNAKSCRAFYRTQNKRCRHVDIVIRVHQFCVWVSNHSVGWGSSANLFWCVRIAQPRMRVRFCNFAEARPEFAD